MFEDLKEIICEYVDVAPETIKEDSRFIEDLGFNSYDFMSMVGEIEEKFDVEVEEREVVNVKTVKDAVDYIQSLQAQQAEKSGGRYGSRDIKGYNTARRRGLWRADSIPVQGKEGNH